MVILVVLVVLQIRLERSRRDADYRESLPTSV